MHSLLKRQVARWFGTPEAVPESLRPFLETINEAYESFDDDRRMLERSLDLSSAELLQANSEMRAIFQAIPDFFFRVAEDGRILDFKGNSSDLDRPPKELIGMRMQDASPDSVGRQFADAIARVRSARALTSIEYTLRMGGEDRIFEARLLPALENQIIVVVRNVTERTRVAEDLAAQRAFLRQVVDLMPSFVFAKDREGRFTLVNQAVADVYGTTVDELLGKTDADFNPNEQQVASFRRDDLEVITTGREKLVLEEPITDVKSGVRFLQTIKRPIVSDDGRVDQVLGVSMDITEHKKLEEQLRQSQKMEAIGLLAGGVAHDFNNLLSVISGYTELAASLLPPGHGAQTSLDSVLAAAERAADLTRQLLAFSRRQVLQVQLLDLNDVLASFSTMLARIVGEDIELRFERPGEPLTVRADAGQLEQVLLNLCTNARQAMHDGGRLTIATRRFVIDDAFVASNPWARAGEYVLLSVADTGVGMDAATRERIFEPFFTTKARGTGLGLATVYGIVRQHDGMIQFDSDPGAGTVCKIFLPLHPTAIPAGLGGATPDRLEGGRETLLIAEDEPALRKLIAASLTGLGYDVLLAEDGEEAIRQYSQRREEIDLVILDAVMPRRNGIEAYRAMKELRPGLKAIFVSGYAPDSARLAELIEAERVPFLAKPFGPRALAARVRELLDAR